MENETKGFYRSYENYSNEDEDEPFSTPVEVLSEFLSALMSRNYKSALYYCNIILQYEPENETVQEFYPLIQMKLHTESVHQSESDGEIDEVMASLSEASTEYFTSSTLSSTNTSVCSSFSNDEDVSPELTE